MSGGEGVLRCALPDAAWGGAGVDERRRPGSGVDGSAALGRSGGVVWEVRGMGRLGDRLSVFQVSQTGDKGDIQEIQTVVMPDCVPGFVN